MSARAKVVLDVQGDFYGIRFDCPGCDDAKVLPVNWLPDGKQESQYVKSWPHWGFNGDMELPTFTPSVLSQGPGALQSDGLRHPDRVCHSFVTDGRIQFLGDCTHALAGQTVDLPPVEKDDQ